MTWIVALVCSASAALHLKVVVPRLREPERVHGDPAPRYATLAPPRHVAALAVMVFALAQVLHRVPPEHLGMWVGYLGAGAALVWVDLRTTWLPRTLNSICGAQVALALVWVAVVDWRSALASAAGATVAYVLFHLVWRQGFGLGYGDVRLAAIVGAMAGLRGLDGWLVAMLCGTLLGAAWGVAHTLLRSRTGRPAHFPYGPALWLGPVVSAALSGW